MHSTACTAQHAQHSAHRLVIRELRLHVSLLLLQPGVVAPHPQLLRQHKVGQPAGHGSRTERGRQFQGFKQRELSKGAAAAAAGKHKLAMPPTVHSSQGGAEGLHSPVDAEHRRPLLQRRRRRLRAGVAQRVQRVHHCTTERKMRHQGGKGSISRPGGYGEAPAGPQGSARTPEPAGQPLTTTRSHRPRRQHPPGPKISSMQPMGVRSSSTSRQPSFRARLPPCACRQQAGAGAGAAPTSFSAVGGAHASQTAAPAVQQAAGG